MKPGLFFKKSTKLINFIKEEGVEEEEGGGGGGEGRGGGERGEEEDKKRPQISNIRIERG